MSDTVPLVSETMITQRTAERLNTKMNATIMKHQIVLALKAVIAVRTDVRLLTAVSHQMTVKFRLIIENLMTLCTSVTLSNAMNTQLICFQLMTVLETFLTFFTLKCFNKLKTQWINISVNTLKADNIRAL